MTYISGICNNVDPGPTLYGLMAPALTTAGFTLVDTVVISTRTHKVWKSAAASNTANLDWYLDIGYPTTGSGQFTMQPFEFFDPATDLGYRGLYSASDSIIDPATSSRYGATGYALETNWVGKATSTIYSPTLPASAFNYYMSITTNRVIMLVDPPSPAIVFYIGMYTPDPLYAAKAGAGLYPLVGSRISPAGSGNWGQSSSSGATISAALTRIAPYTSMTFTWSGSLEMTPLYGLSAGPHNAPATAYPVVALPLYWQLQLSSIGRVVYGSPIDVLSLSITTAVRGDTFTIDGNTWLVGSSNGGFAVLFKAI